MTILFRQTRELESEVEAYLDLILQGGERFRQGVTCYLEHRLDEFADRLHELRAVEQRGDKLRRAILGKLYLQALVPESRCDVLGLLEAADEVLKQIMATLLRFSVESPRMPDDLNTHFRVLAENAIASVESMVGGCRSYFHDRTDVRDSITRVQGYREEVNRIAESYIRAVFQRDLPLSQKNQLRYFAANTEEIAERADDVCDRLAIAAIKRATC